MKETGNKGGRERLDPLGVGELSLVGAWGFLFFVFLWLGIKHGRERDAGGPLLSAESPKRGWNGKTRC